LAKTLPNARVAHACADEDGGSLARVLPFVLVAALGALLFGTAAAAAAACAACGAHAPLADSPRFGPAIQAITSRW
jgi:hypothetical protein